MTTIDCIYERMNDDIELNEKTIDLKQSQIRQFYAGQTIFLSGCTGFIGKCVVEKLLRSCPEIKKLYLLVRQRKDEQTIQDRLKYYFTNIIFEKLHKTYPNFMEKIEPVKGDLMLPGIGLSAEDRKRLASEVNLIIHNAANVQFDEQISRALAINVLGTKEMLDLACECEHLKGFLYVSTGYSHCYMKNIEEQYYRPPADLKMVQDMLQADKENASGLSNEAIAAAIEPWPNTYTFTKATAEGVVYDYGRRVNFPCAIYRPTIVLATYKEPIAMWSGNKNGPALSFMATCLGIIHACFLHRYPLDMCPADMATNALLASIWDAVTNKTDEKKTQYYNYGSSTTNPITIEEMEHLTYEDRIRNPSIKNVWILWGVLPKTLVGFYFFHFFFHCIPAFLADLFIMVQGKKPMFLPILFRVQKHLDKLFYFANGNWRIYITQMLKVVDRMNEADRALFFCDMRIFDWADYMDRYWSGIRLYLMNESQDTIPAGRKRHFKLYVLHHTLVTVFWAVVVYYMYRILSYVFGF
ncbi:fatty acyl-CoA reductase wat-like [Prorops nasuta]|uniref:fatty acyl-CoA reductase wat-like n=1 Tax=Prorops nasuta TaxID=863751 RepID=UPI0034CF48A7